MKAIIISEKRFDELFDAFLNELRLKARDPNSDDAALSFRTVNYYACQFKAKLKDGYDGTSPL